MNPAQRARVNRYIDAAHAAGIPLLAQGQIASDVPAGGYDVRPALFGGRAHRVAKAVRAGQVFGKCYGAGAVSSCPSAAPSAAATAARRACSRSRN